MSTLGSQRKLETAIQRLFDMALEEGLKFEAAVLKTRRRHLARLEQLAREQEEICTD